MNKTKLLEIAQALDLVGLKAVSCPNTFIVN